MTLAKKTARSITVNGQRFRWCVAPNDEPGMAIVVESASAQGQRMVTWVAHRNTISPWVVRQAIINALESGWHPQERGPELILGIRGSIHSKNENA